MQKNVPSKTGLLPNPKDDLGLDFANTLYWRGKDAGTETLNTWSDLLAWCKAAPATTPSLLAAVGAEVAAGRLDQQAALQSARSVREAIYRLMTSAADGQPDYEAGLKSARVWGSGAFDGQTVGRDHVLRDKDVVELHL